MYIHISTKKQYCTKQEICDISERTSEKCTNAVQDAFSSVSHERQTLNMRVRLETSIEEMG